MKKFFYYFLVYLFSPLYLGIVFLFALTVRLNNKRFAIIAPRLVWGSTPIINNVYWSRAMKNAGYKSTTFTNGYFSTINKREDWDLLLEEKYSFLPYRLRPYWAFADSLFKYDVFFISVDGFFLGDTPLWNFEHFLLAVAEKKTVLIPYGGDAFVYNRIKSTTLTHGLLMSYPHAAKQQNEIAKRLDYWTKKADFVNPGMMGPDGFGRWDMFASSSLAIDAQKWVVSNRVNNHDGVNGTVFVAHAPNHRGFKGTEFVIFAIEQLRLSGLKVELILLEKIQNSEVKEIFQHRIDILVEQLIAPGHGINAIEGMASGIAVISNLDDDDYLLPFRRWSFFSECPLVSASPESIVDVLRKLVTSPELRRQLGAAGREYVEKYHSLDSAQYLFTEIIEFCYGRRKSLINLYHPLLGEYPKRKPKVSHPLVNNRIVG